MRTLTHLLLAVLLALAAPARADDAPIPASPTATPSHALRAHVGIHLLAIRHLDVGAGVFEAELYLWIRWRGDTALDLGGIDLANGTASRKELVERTDQEGRHRLLFRVNATLNGTFPLGDFPLDRQALTIAIEHPAIAAGALALEPDLEGTGVAPSFDIPGWSFDRQFGAYAANVPQGPAAFGDDARAERSRAIFTVYLHRPVVSLLVKILVPLLLVLVMSHGSFWVDASDATTRLMLISTSIFVGVCVHIVLTETMPTVNYLTAADVYFLVVYVFLGLEFTAAIASSRLHSDGRLGAVRRLDLIVRFGLPPVAICAALLGSVPGARVDPGLKHGRPPVPPSARPSLVVGLAKPVERLGPHGDRSVVEQMVTRLLWAPLCELDPQGVPRASMAREVPSLANGGVRLKDDGSGVVRWRLREAPWGDGTPVTTADVVRDAQPFGTFAGARDVTVDRDGSIVVTYPGLRPGLIFDGYLFPERRLSGLDPAGKERVMTRELPPLSGSFVLERLEPGKEVALVRNPRHEPLAALERIVVRTYPSRDALADAFRRGEAQLVPAGEIEVADALPLAASVEGARAHVQPPHYQYHLDVNLEDPLLRDRRVRQALLYALDREAMVRDLLRGRGAVAHTWLPPGHPAAGAEIRRYDRDLGHAARLLDEAGLRLGPEGKRLDAQGKPLRFTVTRGDRHPRGIVEQIARDWGALGIGVDDEPIEYGRYMDVTTTRLEWRHFALWGYDLTPYETGHEYWTEAAIPTEKNGWQGYNCSRWREPRMADIFHRLDRTVSSEDMVELLETQQRIWAEEVPVIMLYGWEQATLVGPGLRGVRPHAAGSNLLGWNCAEWRFSE